MKINTAFTVYDAAAGSGKTYTLVREYLCKILSSTNKNRYKQILAVTFTNKAVAEMKTRILSSLYEFSQDVADREQSSMFFELIEELGISKSELHKKSKEVLHYLLHNYTSFSVQTIDKFTQSVIRTFAFDLNLATNFEVELDQTKALEQAVDNLINEVGNDKDITKTVIDFAKLSIGDDSNWNIKNSLLDTAQILFKEDQLIHIEKLSAYTSKDFEDLGLSLRYRLNKNKELIKKLASEIVLVLQEQGVLEEFNRNLVPKHFQKLKNTAQDDFSAVWKQNISEATFYTAKKGEAIKQQIDNLRPVIETSFIKTKELVFENYFIERILKNRVQMSLLKKVNEKLQEFKKENKILLISDFNTLIHKTIKNQPTPFIYERLGERYKDFFVDEFQDTSEMQWQNLLPLADNAVSSLLENEAETGTVTIVGDAKQAIYRWRGGKAEQFIDLSIGKSPFSNPEKQTLLLDTNYRSYSNIIKFNNDFFSFLSSSFTNTVYQDLYLKGNQQKVNHKTGGYVQFSFVEAENATVKDELYPKEVFNSINQILNSGFKLNEICILVRKNSEGVTIGDYLNKKNIPIISSETLLVKNSNEVLFLISILEFVITPNDLKKKLEFLKLLSTQLHVKEVHVFLKEFLDFSVNEIELKLKEFEIDFKFNCFHNQNLYEAFESTIRCFKIHKKSSANIQFFMDFVFEYTQKKNEGLGQFIDYWEQKKEKLSVIVPEGKQAVQIMTIHKSKGLEFPVIIFPYADTQIYKKQPVNMWTGIGHLSEVFEEAYVSYNKKIFENYTPNTAQLVLKTQELLELDNFNVLYVALTRAKEQLYIISNCYKTKSGLPLNSFQGYFNAFLEQNTVFKKETDTSYYLGNRERTSTVNTAIALENYIKNYNCSIKENHGIHVVKNSKVIPLDRQKSIDSGLLFHKLMSKVKCRSDVHKVVSKFRSLIGEREILNYEKNIRKIVDSEVLKNCFNKENTIFCEREFVYKGNTLIPDRVDILKDNTVIIIDYKTGKREKKHQFQIKEYADIFYSLRYKRVENFIVYLNEKENLIDILSVV